jgi:hypothetical protein
VPKKRSGTRAGAATPSSYDNTTPIPSQQASYEPFRQSSVPTTPHQIVLQLMIWLTRLEQEIMMFLKELAKYPEIAAQIEEFLDRVRNLADLYFRYYFSVYSINPSTAVKEPDEVGQLIDELVSLEAEWKKFVEENKLWIAFL